MIRFNRANGKRKFHIVNGEKQFLSLRLKRAFHFNYQNTCLLKIKTISVDKMFICFLSSIPCTNLCLIVYNECHISQEVNAVDQDRAIHLIVNMSHHQLFSCLSTHVFLFSFPFFWRTHRRDCLTINHSPSDTSASLIPRASHCTICPFTLIHGDEGALTLS